jgi:hypothetical protein
VIYFISDWLLCNILWLYHCDRFYQVSIICFICFVCNFLCITLLLLISSILPVVSITKGANMQMRLGGDEEFPSLRSHIYLYILWFGVKSIISILRVRPYILYIVTLVHCCVIGRFVRKLAKIGAHRRPKLGVAFL